MISIPLPPLHLRFGTMELFYPFQYSLAFAADSISSKDNRIIIRLFLPMFFFNSLDLEMTRVTIITFKTNMRSSLVTVYTLPALRIDTNGSEVFVHHLIWHVGFM
jgi:hypothetical protein